MCEANTELYHWGIKGQKWGVRRYQNKDGSLTPAGKKRYADESGEKPTKESRYDQLYSKYKTIGYSDKRAKEAAMGQVKTERALKVIGGVAVTAAAAYAAYRIYDINADRVIKPGRVIQTVHNGDIADRIKPDNPFYASYTKRDGKIYGSKVFSHFTDKSNVSWMFTEDGIKVASEKSGRKVFDELVKTNPEVAEYSKKIGYFGKGRKAYERFNYSLVLRNDSDTAKKMGLDKLDHDKIHKIFYDELKKKGYGAVIDVNDSRKEGFTFNPVIIFDSQRKHVVGTAKATALQAGEQYRAGRKWATRRMHLTNPLTFLLRPDVALAGYGLANSLGAVKDNSRRLAVKAAYVERYKQEHPNTKLTNAQIAKMYERQNS